MINLTAAQQNIVKSDSAIKNFRVHFPNGENSDLTNDDIVFETVKFTESVCSEQTFRFGCAEASVIEFETVGVANIIGMTIECSMTFTLGDESVTVPYGVFIVDSCPRDHKNMTHRKVTAYSLIKYMFDAPNFLQNKVLPVPEAHVSVDAIKAYVTGDVSEFTEHVLSNLTGNPLFRFGLHDSSGRQYRLQFLDSESEGVVYGNFRWMFSERSLDTYFNHYHVLGYKLSYTEESSITNEQFGLSISDYLNSLELELFYDENGNKVYETNEEALRDVYGFLFKPTEYYQTVDLSGYPISYRQNTPVELDKFTPIINDDLIDVMSRRCVVFAVGNTRSVQVIRSSSANVYASSTTFDSIGNLSIEYRSSAVMKLYSKQVSNLLEKVAIKNTLTANSAMYVRKASNRDKVYYGNVYAFSNAYSNRDVLNGWAEINCAFVHSERDGSVSMESLNNSNPYQLELSDVEGSAWWDEYDVNPIGTVKYTFFNPFTGKIANGTYTFNENAKSVYDLSGNKVLEAMDFRIKKAKTVSAMTDENIWYRYTGTETGYTADDFYYYDGTAWTSGGHYSGVNSLVEFVLDQLFIPHINAVNFTPVEMSIRGLPYLEAGDAFTLTANDGSVLNSYILNHTFDGIQHISEDITSVSGEIIE